MAKMTIMRNDEGSAQGVPVASRRAEPYAGRHCDSCELCVLPRIPDQKASMAAKGMFLCAAVVSKRLTSSPIIRRPYLLEGLQWLRMIRMPDSKTCFSHADVAKKVASCSPTRSFGPDQKPCLSRNHSTPSASTPPATARSRKEEVSGVRGKVSVSFSFGHVAQRLRL